MKKLYKRMNRKLMLLYLNEEKDTLLILKALIIVKKKEEGYSELDTIRSLHRYLKNDEESKKLYSKKLDL